MKNSSSKLTGLLCLCSILLLPLLSHSAAASARGTGSSIPIHSDLLISAAPPTAGSEMGPIGAGWYHTCALTATQGVACWGRNDYGQLGNDSIIDSNVPVSVSGLSSGFTAVTGGRWHTCALSTTGGVMCWGGNLSGQLGNNTTYTSHVPVNVFGLSSGVSAIATGFYHSCALTASTGGVMCWGYNGFGILGIDSTANSDVPVGVTGLSSGVSAIAAGFYHTCALMSDTGGVKCWGRNLSGQLGNNSTTDSNVPVDVSGLTSGVRAIAAGDDHTCVLMEATRLMKCWGSNNSGQFGNNTITAGSLVPVDVTGLTTPVSAIAAGGLTTCALTTAGGVKCWGAYGGSIVPADVVGLSNGVSAIAMGQTHICALKTSGGKVCWGNGQYGQLGNNSNDDSSVPVDVVGFPALPMVISISRANPQLTNASSVVFTVTFSKSVTGVDPSDFNLAATGVSGATVSGISGSGNTYMVTGTTGSGIGTLRLDLIDNDTIQDDALIPLGGTGTGNGDYTSGEMYSVRFTPSYIPLIRR